MKAVEYDVIVDNDYVEIIVNFGTRQKEKFKTINDIV